MSYKKHQIALEALIIKDRAQLAEKQRELQEVDQIDRGTYKHQLIDNIKKAQEKVDYTRTIIESTAAHQISLEKHYFRQTASLNHLKKSLQTLDQCDTVDIYLNQRRASIKEDIKRITSAINKYSNKLKELTSSPPPGEATTTSDIELSKDSGFHRPTLHHQSSVPLLSEAL